MYVGVNPKTTNPFRTTKNALFTHHHHRLARCRKNKNKNGRRSPPPPPPPFILCFDHRNRAIPRLLVVVFSVVARSKRERFKSNANTANSLKNVLTKLKSAFSLNTTTTIDTNTIPTVVVVVVVVSWRPPPPPRSSLPRTRNSRRRRRRASKRPIISLLRTHSPRKRSTRSTSSTPSSRTRAPF